jgi:hypothetical protein
VSFEFKNMRMYIKKIKLNFSLIEKSLLNTIDLWKMLMLASLIMCGCVPENTVPAYIHIPAFNTEAGVGQGTSAQKITDVWVYVNGQINGVFPLPATVPIAELGKQDITLFPGIRNNGTRSNPVIYPFMNEVKISKDLISNKLDTIKPTLMYLARTKFWIVEDFENGNTFNVNRDNNNAFGFNIAPNGFEGKCLEATINKTNPRIEKASKITAQLADNAENIYLEMHYKTEALLSVGIIGFNAATPNGVVNYKITLKPNQEWNKIYINLTNEAKSLQMKDFKIVFEGVLAENTSSAKIQIDNVKLLEK